MRKIYISLGCALLLQLTNSLTAQVFVNEDFSSATGTTPPAGWTNNEIYTGGGVWAFDNPGGRTANFPMSAPFAIFDSDYLETFGEEAAIESPAFDASTATGDIYLSFYQFFKGDFSGESYVEVWDGTAWQEVYYNNETTTNPEQQVINITSVANGATDAQVRFRWNGDDDLYWIVDNIKVEALTCPPVTDFALDMTTTNSVSFSWTAGGAETNWDVQYGPAGFALGSGTMMSATNDSITVSLTPDTEYDFYVRANCGADQSLWVGPLSALAGYCYTVGTNEDYYINNFSTTGGSTNISNLNSGFNGYENNISMAVSSFDGGPDINFSTDFDSDGGTYGLGIWVDWNNDTIFQSGEQMFISDDYYDSYTGSFGVPTGTPVGNYRMRVLASYEEQAPADACYLDTQEGEVEDYTFTVTAAPACLPVSNLDFTIVTADSIAISWTAVASQTDWDIQYGPAGFTLGMGMMASSTTESFGIGSLTADTEYDFYVRADCGGSQSLWIGPITALTGYCDVAGIASNHYINNFSTTGGQTNISNLNSGFHGYENNTSMIISSFDGAPDINFDVDFDINDGTYGFGVWVDWNNDLTFDATEQMFVSDSYETQFSGSFGVPAGTAVGSYRMRIMGAYWDNSPTDACYLDSDNGEVEDYTFEVLPQPSCMPVADLAIANQTSASIDIMWTSQGTETSWDIEYGVAGFNQGSGIMTSSSTASFSASPLLADTDYDFYVRANCGGDQSVWNHITGRTGYCEIAGVDPDYYINNFSTTGGLSSNISNLNSGYNNGYANDTTMVVSSFDGGPDVNFHVDFGSSSFSNFGVGIWVDWDNDLIFDASEQMFVSSSYETDFSGSFGIPSGTPVGLYRMRVLADYEESAPSDACSLNTSFSSPTGEIEDYTFEVLPVPSCLPVSDIVTSNITTTSADLVWTVNGSEGLWNIQWGPVGFTPGTGTEEGSASSNDIVYTVNTLNPATTYDLYIQANCGADSSYWTMVTFTTLCAPITTLPWTENFDAMTNVDYGLFPNCWYDEGVEWLTDNSNITIGTAYSGDNFLAIKYASDDYIWTPEFQLTAGGNYEFTFMMGGDGYDGWDGDLSVSGSQSSADATIIGDPFIEPSDIFSGYRKLTYCFTPDTSGVYSFGLHVSSDFNPYVLTFDDFKLIERTGSAGTDGTMNVCQTGGLVDLNDVITKDDQTGVWSFGPNPATIVSDSLFNPEFVPSGTVYVNYITTGCLVDTATAIVTIYGPSMAGEDGSISACKNEPLNLLSGLNGTITTGGDWYDPTNAQLPSGQITTGAFPGSFNYRYITGNGICPDDTSLVVVTITNCDWLTIGENELEGVNVYPNPSTGLVYIESTFSTGSFNLVITDVNGRVIDNKNNTISAGTNAIHLENAERGIYFFKLSNNAAEKVYRVVIE